MFEMPNNELVAQVTENANTKFYMLLVNILKKYSDILL